MKLGFVHLSPKHNVTVTGKRLLYRVQKSLIRKTDELVCRTRTGVGLRRDRVVHN